MVGPNDFVASPSASRVKQNQQKRKKTMRTVSKKRKSNEKSRRVSIREPTKDQSHVRTRSSTRNTTHQNNDIDEDGEQYEKENANHGFTPLIQTKLMEIRKRQGKRNNQAVSKTAETVQSPSAIRKRQRIDNEESPAVPPKSNEKNPSVNAHHENQQNKEITPTDPKTTCQNRCDAKDHHLPAINKRRRPCLCSKRQLDELEFAVSSTPSQFQPVQEEHPTFEEPCLAPNVTSTNHSPPPLLLQTSVFIAPTSHTHPALPAVPSVNERDETNQVTESEDKEEEEEEKENGLRASSTMIAPLSPTMPLNATYIARRSIAPVTPFPSTLFALSSIVRTSTSSITVQENPLSHSTISVNPVVNDQENLLNPSVSIEPVPSVTNPIPVVSNLRCSVSTQTNDDDYPIHHQCHDVSECPCVQIYTRSEQLFMTSMAAFFRHSMHITAPSSEQSLPALITTNRITMKPNQRQTINHQDMVPQATPINNEMEVPIVSERNVSNKDNHSVNETYVIDHRNDILPSFELPHAQSSSTVINETHHDCTKKTDGSSIQIHMNTREELKEISPQANRSAILSNDRQKFQSLVLAMTALKEDQKAEFNRFIECFSVRFSPTIDDTTTHLITDEDTENSLVCPLTGKVLQAVARHLTIVSHRWLTACLTEQRYIEEIPTYEIMGDSVYNQHNGMSRSRLIHSSNSRLLANYAFHLKCHGCQPFIDNRPLIELIHLSGGLILKTLNQHIDNIGRQIVILCSKSYLQNKPALQQACQKLNIRCVEPEWLIATVVKFSIQTFQPWLCTLY